jgi:putative ATPase
MRPRTLDEYIGQEHIVGKGRLLRRAIAADQLTSVIFYGPPGTGKTTLARVIANHTKSNFITLNAVLTGVKDIREATEKADLQRKMYGRRTILFVDEVHRWNKSQQDALLPWVENGTIILVGATTENPFFEVNKALVSRSRVFQLLPLERADLLKAARAALADRERGYGRWAVRFEEGALEHLIGTANGDARSLLNALELAVETSEWRMSADRADTAPSVNGSSWPPPEGAEIPVSMEAAEESIQKKVVLYDRDGDYHYDIISAFIKSLRGRDPDAAVYWMARMVRAGEDPHFIFRRMLISACEDTGLADPQAISVVESCARAFDRVGFPEGNYFLAHAALYLSTAPKSNSSMAFFDALKSVEAEDAEVPNHLKDPSRDAEGFGHGEGYMYPHAYRDHWVAQQYLPSSLQGRVFFTPGSQGYEKTIRDGVLSRRETQIAALLEEEADIQAGKKLPQGEQLTYSPGSRARESALERGDAAWRKRLDENRAAALLALRDALVLAAGLGRHHRCMVWGADDGLLLWELTRKCPEGAVAGVCLSEGALGTLSQYAATLGEIERPALAVAPPPDGPDGGFLIPPDFGEIPFDRLFFRNNVKGPGNAANFARSLKKAADGGRLAAGWRAVLALRVPSSGQRLSRFVEAARQMGLGQDGSAPLIRKFAASEDEFFAAPPVGERGFSTETLVDALRRASEEVFGEGAPGITGETFLLEERRRFDPREIQKWFSPQSAYGGFIRDHAGEEAAEAVRDILLQGAGRGMVFERTVETGIVTVNNAVLTERDGVW